MYNMDDIRERVILVGVIQKAVRLQNGHWMNWQSLRLQQGLR